MPIIKFLNLLLSLFLLQMLLIAQVSAQVQPEIKPGIINRIQQLIAQNETREVFIFLPNKPYPESEFPLIFITDPSGRVIEAMNQYLELADSLNIVLAGTKEVSNGPVPENLLALKKDLEVVLNTGFIDRSKVFLLGFSGTARISVAFAIRYPDLITGVIASGAGFIPEDIAYSDRLRSYTVVIGRRDMNYSEVLGNKNTMDEKGIKNSIVITEKGHEWPDAEDLKRALSYCGTLPDPEFLNNELKKAENYLREGDVVSAYFQHLCCTGSGIIDPDTKDEALKLLRDEAKTLAFYTTAIKSMYHYGQGLQTNDYSPSWWKSQKKQLNRKFQKGLISIYRYDRMYSFMILNLYERALIESEFEKNYSSAINFLRCLLVLEPNHSGYHQWLSSLYEKTNDLKKASYHREMAIQIGSSKTRD